MASSKPIQVFSIRRSIVPCVLSVLFMQTTLAAPTLVVKDDIDSRLNNPCHYNPHSLRHQRSLKNSEQKNFTQVQLELKKVRKDTNRTLKIFQKMYQNSATLSWSFDAVPSRITSKVAGYHGLQAFMKAIDLMSLQIFPSTNEVSSKRRKLKLTELLNKSTVLLCEVYDDIHAHNMTTEILLVAKNKEVESVSDKIPSSVERSDLSTQDREVLKKYRKFLKDLWQFYRPAKSLTKKEKLKRNGGNKSTKKSNKKGNNNKKNQQRPTQQKKKIKRRSNS